MSLGYLIQTKLKEENKVPQGQNNEDWVRAGLFNRPREENQETKTSQGYVKRQFMCGCWMYAHMSAGSQRLCRGQMRTGTLSYSSASSS